MRFIADENVSRVVIDKLRAAGFDVTSIIETAPGSADTATLKIAQAQSCVLITEDNDFGELVIRQQLGIQSLILLELDRLSNAAEAAAVLDVVSGHADKLLGNLVVIQPGRVRIRPLPQPSGE